MSQMKEMLAAALEKFETFKDTHPTYVLFFRMGDFYECFHSDATKIHRVLGVTLTTCSNGAESIPMAGVPAHAIEGYLRRMISAGHRVALIDGDAPATTWKPKMTAAAEPVASPTPVVIEGSTPVGEVVAKPARVTLATFKRFVKANAGKLHTKTTYHDRGDVDWNGDDAEEKCFTPAAATEHMPEHTIGVQGVWLSLGGRDRFRAFEEDGFKGICVSTCNRVFYVAVPLTTPSDNTAPEQAGLKAKREAKPKETHDERAARVTAEVEARVVAAAGLGEASESDNLHVAAGMVRAERRAFARKSKATRAIELDHIAARLDHLSLAAQQKEDGKARRAKELRSKLLERADACIGRAAKLGKGLEEHRDGHGSPTIGEQTRTLEAFRPALRHDRPDIAETFAAITTGDDDLGELLAQVVAVGDRRLAAFRDATSPAQIAECNRLAEEVDTIARFAARFRDDNARAVA